MPKVPRSSGRVVKRSIARPYDTGVSTLVFLPAWNEAENLPAVLEEVRLVLPEADLLVVDDGSTDATAEVARAGGAEVVSFSENHGLPAAVAAGYTNARKQSCAPRRPGG